MAQDKTSNTPGAADGDLENMPLEAACRFYRNYLDAFQVDLPLAIRFINRALDENQRAMPEEARTLMLHAVASAVRLAGFDPQVLRIGQNTGVASGADGIVKVIEGTHVEPELFEEIRQAPLKHLADEVRRVCTTVLAQHPMALRYADLLLRVDYFEGKPADEALARFRCPKVLQPLWTRRLFAHYAGLGDDERAWPLWQALQPQPDDPFALVQAAEMFRRRGDLAQAMALYRRAMELDPLQHPYALRLAALQNPFVPDQGLVAAKRVCICLYSYNKAQILGETLDSLSRCAIGPARIKILLNGCTDDSEAVVAKARELFPDNDVESISLPVNIGAPAARNWLLAHPHVRESEYVAFLDDDVFLQPDWLAHLLTVAESDPRIGNVGCKVVFPGRFPLLQYLYRHVATATEDAVRISLPTPYMQYDIGLYDVIRETRVVMGCQHLLRVAALADAPWFDIRYSPSQVDDTDHDLQLCLAGWKVVYCGTVTCVHRQDSGASMRRRASPASMGNVRGNDVKFHYKWLEHVDRLAALDSLGTGR